MRCGPWLCGARVCGRVVLPLRSAHAARAAGISTRSSSLRLAARSRAVIWSSCSGEEGGATDPSSNAHSARNAAGATPEEGRAPGTCSGAGTAPVEAGAVGTSVGSVVVLVAALVVGWGCARAQARIPPRPEHGSSSNPRA